MTGGARAAVVASRQAVPPFCELSVDATELSKAEVRTSLAPLLEAST